MTNSKVRDAIYELLTQFKCDIRMGQQGNSANSPWFMAAVDSKYAPDFEHKVFRKRGYFNLYQDIKNFLLTAERAEIALGGPGGS